MCKNCDALNLQQDRIMDIIIEKQLGIMTIRHKFSNGPTATYVYGKDGNRLRFEME